MIAVHERPERPRSRIFGRPPPVDPRPAGRILGERHEHEGDGHPGDRRHDQPQSCAREDRACGPEGQQDRSGSDEGVTRSCRVNRQGKECRDAGLQARRLLVLEARRGRDGDDGPGQRDQLQGDDGEDAQQGAVQQPFPASAFQTGSAQQEERDGPRSECTRRPGVDPSEQRDGGRQEQREEGRRGVRPPRPTPEARCRSTPCADTRSTASSSTGCAGGPHGSVPPR